MNPPEGMERILGIDAMNNCYRELTRIVEEACAALEREIGMPPGPETRTTILRRLQALVGSGISDPAKLRAFTLMGLQLEGA